MPLHEYQCRNCEESFEEIISFSDADKLPACPNCGRQETQKKISAGAVIGSSSDGGYSSAPSVPAPRFT